MNRRFVNDDRNRAVCNVELQNVLRWLSGEMRRFTIPNKDPYVFLRMLTSNMSVGAQ
jgi:hypothetical protein